MRLFDYIRIQKLWLLSLAVIMMVLNSILFSSLSLNKGIQDIVYLNLLIMTIQAVFFIYGFIRHKRNYASLLQHAKGNPAQHAHNSDFYLELFAALVEEKKRVFAQKEEDYKKNMNETQEYMTQWVHDIKVNLAVCDLLLEELENNYELRNQMEQMKYRIHQVLQITRANHYDQDMAATEVDVCLEIRRAIKHNALFFIHKNIEIQTNLHPFTVISDQKWVFDILCQILNNCSKYTPHGGQLLISAQEEETAYYVRIRDNGVGIPKGDIPRIFDKGFTGKNGRSGTKSTGMGLYYAKKMADRLCISIEVESKEGAYTEFTLIFYKLSDYFTISSSRNNMKL
ncbi:sensor histidine kinase [Paenibacillus puerhi]|uniref:sensor histidine kinase n=1 Tax=Paenibacillus puerhi TaxID=2692622 RepID=UPI00135A3D30|nr:sensor histidine kinase [Paenibacillus puerhi]